MPMKRLLILALFCAGTYFCTVATAHANPLYPAQGFMVDLAPSGVVFGDGVKMRDVNGDGHLDILTANSILNGKNPGSVSVLLGNGEGTFRSPVSYPLGAQPSAFAVKDVNGDGHVDMVVAHADKNTVSILLGKGDGTFGEPQTFPAGAKPSGLAIQDVNGNDVPDLLVINEDGALSVLLGNGDGTFQAPQTYDTGTKAVLGSIAVKDFNGDGHLDVATTGGIQDVLVMPGNGDGSFQSTYSVPAVTAGHAANALVAGDVNGDGLPDIVVTSHDSDPKSGGGIGTVNVLINKGDGTFQSPVAYAVGSYPSQSTLADLDGDGNLDIAVPNKRGDTRTVSVLLGNGDGTFQPQKQTGSLPGKFFWKLASGDVNEDGHTDLVTAGGASGMATVLLGQGDGNLLTQQTTEVGNGEAPRQVATADFNGDGYSDFVSFSQGSTFQGISIAISNGNGTFKAVNNKPGYVFSVATADINGDEIPDIVAATVDLDTSTALIAVYIGLGDGTFQVPLYSPGGPPIGHVAVSDVNGDGKPDVVASSLVFLQRQAISVLLGNGDGTFQSAQSYAAGGEPEHIVVKDMNGDGIKDIVVNNRLEEGGISVLPGNGDGSFQAPLTDDTGGYYPDLLAVTDANNDGIPDVVTGDDQSGASILMGNGDGTFQSPQPLETNGIMTALRSVTASDVTGDGNADLIFTASGSNAVMVLPAQGDGGFLGPRFYAVGFGPNSAAIGDANGDGLPDLFVANAAGKAATVGVLLHLAVDEAPVASDGTLTTQKNKAAGGTLKASDPDDDELVFSIVDGPAHGSVTLDDASAGSYTYTPADDYVGSDSFTFIANDGQKDSNVATVSINVEDGAPVASDGALTTQENKAAGGTLKASDPEGDELVFSIVDGPTHGSVTLDDAGTGSYTYTPDQDYAGADSFTFVANDGEKDSNVATISISVEKAAPPPDKDGGGGGMLPLGLAFLAFMALAAYIRKYARNSKESGPRGYS